MDIRPRAPDERISDSEFFEMCGLSWPDDVEEIDFSITGEPGADMYLPGLDLTSESVSTKPWSNFSQSDYSDEQWKSACAMDTGSGNTPKERYKLPVKEPDGTLNSNAVHAAASALAGGRGGVQASPDAKKAAAKKLLSHYKAIGDDPPDSLKQAAGQQADASSAREGDDVDLAITQSSEGEQAPPDDSSGVPGDPKPGTRIRFTILGKTQEGILQSYDDDKDIAFVQVNGSTVQVPTVYIDGPANMTDEEALFNAFDFAASFGVGDAVKFNVFGKWFSGKVASIDGKTATVKLSNGSTRKVPVSVLKADSSSSSGASMSLGHNGLDFASSSGTSSSKSSKSSKSSSSGSSSSGSSSSGSSSSSGGSGSSGWDESMHPRAPSGSSGGGQFVSGGGGGSNGSSSSNGSGTDNNFTVQDKKGNVTHTEDSDKALDDAFSQGGLSSDLNTPENRDALKSAIVDTFNGDTGAAEKDISGMNPDLQVDAVETIGRVLGGLGYKVNRDSNGTPVSFEQPAPKSMSRHALPRTTVDFASVDGLDSEAMLPITDSEAIAVDLARGLWRKQLLPLGEIKHGGRILRFTRDVLKNIAAKSLKAFDQVPMNLATAKNEHNEDPTRFAGEVKDFIVTESGLDAIIETNDIGTEVLTNNPRVGTSPRFLPNYIRQHDGESFGPIIRHGCITQDPHITGLGSWEKLPIGGESALQASLSQDALVGAVDLSRAHWEPLELEKGGNMDLPTANPTRKEVSKSMDPTQIQEGDLDSFDFSNLSPDEVRTVIQSVLEDKRKAEEERQTDLSRVAALEYQNLEQETNAYLADLARKGVPTTVLRKAKPYLMEQDRDREMLVVDFTSENGQKTPVEHKTTSAGLMREMLEEFSKLPTARVDMSAERGRAIMSGTVPGRVSHEEAKAKSNSDYEYILNKIGAARRSPQPAKQPTA